MISKIFSKKKDFSVRLIVLEHFFYYFYDLNIFKIKSRRTSMYANLYEDDDKDPNQSIQLLL